MKSRLALCHLSIHDDVRSLISETRTEAMKALGKLKNETPTSTAEERLLTISQKVSCLIIVAYSLFPRARTGPILTSLWAGCKINVFPKCFACIAAPQIVWKQWSGDVAMLYGKRMVYSVAINSWK